MVLTGYVMHDLVVIHHRHCKNTKALFSIHRQRRVRYVCVTQRSTHKVEKGRKTCLTGVEAELLPVCICLYIQKGKEKENQPELIFPIRPYRDIFQTFLTACPIL